MQGVVRNPGSGSAHRARGDAGCRTCHSRLGRRIRHRGARSRLGELEANEEAAHVMQRGRLAHIDGAGHNLHHAQLARTVEVLKEFLATL